MAIHLEKWMMIYTAKEAICMILNMTRKMSWMGMNMIASMLMGKATKTMFSKMESMENIMKASGWFDKSPDGLPDLGNLDRVEPSVQLGSKEWENKINEKRQQLLQGRMTIESNQDDDDINFDQSNTRVFNDVKIVD